MEIYKTYFDCLSVRLHPLDDKTTQLIGPDFFCGHRVTPGKVYG